MISPVLSEAKPLTFADLLAAGLVMRDWTGEKQFFCSPETAARIAQYEGDCERIDAAKRGWRAIARALGWRKRDIREHRFARQGHGRHDYYERVAMAEARYIEAFEHAFKG